MATHKKIDKICIIFIILALLITALIGCNNTNNSNTVEMGYENRLFDTSRVHTIDIVIDDWDSFIENCENEEYVNCAVVIDNEAYKNVGIRAKGNTSLSSVSASGGERYSFKIEFDQYQVGNTYHGLDKLSLNNVIQDNTYMKDYLVYQMMNEFGADSPLCSYVYITVNGKDFGLYLAVEGVEESFLTRNYGSNYGELYKPDSMSMAKKDAGDSKNSNFGNMPGGEMPQMPDMGNIGNFNGDNVPNIDDFDFTGMDINRLNQAKSGESFSRGMTRENRNGNFEIPKSTSGDKTSSFNREDMGNFDFGNMPGGMGGSDVKLQYIDDTPESYSNIFNNAKTDITTSDQNRLIESLKKLSEGKDIENVVDVENVIKYFVVHNFVCNDDSYTGNMIHNYYLYEKDGKLSMIPWDYNLAFGSFGGSSNANSTVNEPIDSFSSDRPMINWIFENEEYTKLYHEYFEQFIEEYYTNGRMTQIIDNAYELIKSYVEKDPTKFCTYEEFEEGVETLKQFCLLRSQSVEGQLSGTIGSTTETQKNTQNELIDASSLELSKLGSMGGGRGGFGNKESSKDNMKVEALSKELEGSGDNEKSSNSSIKESHLNGIGIENEPDNKDDFKFNMESSENFPNGFKTKNQSGDKKDENERIPTNNFDINNFNKSGDVNNGFGFGNMNNRGNRNMGQTPNTNTANNSGNIILVVVSFVFLIAGIVFVKKFKR